MEQLQIRGIEDRALEEEIKNARNNLSTDRLDMSYGEIMNMYEHDEIIISPEFQRLYRWKNEQKTRFMESIILGIPIPPIFVAANEDGVWELVDGLQRLSTILSFFGILKADKKDKNNWKMDQGSIISLLDGVSLETLPKKFELNIKRSTCRIEIIQWDSNYDMRYELFNRLNTGGSILKDQEIRNCVFRGISVKFNNFLKDLSENIKFKEIISPTDKQVDELYLEELILRYSSLFRRSESVNKNISQYMTNFMSKVVKGDIKEELKKDEEYIAFDYQGMEENFLKTTELLHSFGSEIFRASNGSFSSSFFDAIFTSIAENIEYYSNNKDAISGKISELKSKKSFRDLMGSSASSSTRVKNRQRIAKEIFSNETNQR